MVPSSEQKVFSVINTSHTAPHRARIQRDNCNLIMLSAVPSQQLQAQRTGKSFNASKMAVLQELIKCPFFSVLGTVGRVNTEAQRLKKAFKTVN